MNKNYIRLIISSILLLGILILNNVYDFLNSYTLILFLLLFLLFSYWFIGYEKNTQRYQKDIIFKILIYIILYYLITYILGLYLGFTKTGYSLKLMSILNHIWPVIVTIPLIEIIRYIFLTKGSNYKSILLLVIINTTLIDITLLINSYSYGTLYFILLVLVPSIAKNILLSYITFKVGYKPSIIYRLMFEIPIYILPIFPSFGLYIESLLKLSFPLIIIFTINRNFINTRNIEITGKKKSSLFKNIILLITILLLISIITLTSGAIKYYAVTIGSESMVPTINKGDIVIVEKEIDTNILKEGDILVFKHDNIIMVHRIIKIMIINDEKYFYTKGDNNDSEDGYPITNSQVVGLYLCRIPYLGYPTVELNELLKKQD